MLLPSQQSDLPGRDLIDATRLHDRREGTFLVIASLFMIATLALPLWFASSWVAEIENVGELSIGVLVFPVALLLGQLVAEIYGARRAGAMALAGAFGSLAVIGGQYLTVENYPIELALALVACTTVTNATNILVFAGTSRAMDGRALFLRSFVATPVALLAGWSAFALAWIGLGMELDDAIALASAPCLYACGVAIVGALPLIIARKALGTYLRMAGREAPPVDHSLVAPRRRLPPAMIVDEQPVTKKPFTPYTTGEMRFFQEGEEMSQLRDTLV